MTYFVSACSVAAALFVAGHVFCMAPMKQVQKGNQELQLKQDPCGEKLCEQESSSSSGRSVELTGIAGG